MLTEILVMTQTSIAGVTLYGLGLLFVKAMLIVIVAQTLAEQLEFYPAGIRHTVWLLAIICLAVLPLLSGFLPEWNIISLTYPATGLKIDPADEVGVSASFTWFDCLALLYLGVLGVYLGKLLLALHLIAITTITAQQAGRDWDTLARSYSSRRISIKVTPQVSGPVTWGVLRPVILLPISASSLALNEKIMVVQHEIGHIQRADWLTQLLASLVAMLYWPVPGVRLILQNLSLEAERACDNIVLRKGVLPDEYAALLVHQAKLTSLPATVALGSPSELVQRVRHIVSSYIDRAEERKYQLGLALIAAILIFPLVSAKPAWRVPVAENSFSRPVSLVIPLPETPPSPLAAERAIVRPQKPHVSLEPIAHLGREPVAATISQQQAVYSLTSEPGVTGIQPQHWRTPTIRVLQEASPEYPPIAMKRGIEGEVLVEFDIGTSGQVENPRIISSSSGKVFDRAVFTALKAYRFAPPRIGDQEISLSGVRKRFRFQFGDQLTDGDSIETRSSTSKLEKIDSG